MCALKLSIRNEDLDATDAALLQRLMREGRASWADLAEELDLTAPAIAQRVRRLEERGIIRQFAAVVDPAAVQPVAAFLSIRPDRADQRDRMRKQVAALESVQECHFVGGGDDHLVKLRCASLADLEYFVSTVLPKAGAAVTQVRVVLSTLKETPVLPIGDTLQGVRR